MTEYKPLTTADLWLPGSTLGGALLRGWDGPWEKQVHDGLRLRWEYHRESSLPPQGTRLDCNRPEVRDRIVRVLAVGDLCPQCGGSAKEHDGEGCRWDCSACDGTGYFRPRNDLTDITTAEIRGTISPTEAAALLWASVLRVEAGLGPAHQLDTWSEERGGMSGRPIHYRRDASGLGYAWVSADGWEGIDQDNFTVASGTEAGDAGKAAADAAALSAGYALREPGALLLPLVDGVGRLDLP